MLDITADQRRELRARAHALNPVVSISQNGLSESVMQEISTSLDSHAYAVSRRRWRAGLSESVMQEISTSLDSHELIKIRVFSDDRDVREQYLASICEQLGAAPVQHIGKLLVVWRPLPAPRVPPRLRRSPPVPRRSKRSFQGGSRG